MKSRLQRTSARAVSIVILMIVLPLATLPPTAAAGGSFQLVVQGYGTVNGQLENAAIQPDNTISVTMLLNDQLQTPQGAFPISATGIWGGTKNGSSLSGRIQDVKGKVRICILLACSDANFVGEGHWTGLLDATHATGNFDGTITFTNSPVPQIPVGQPIPVAGTWTADFQLPIPEFRAQAGTYILVFVATALMLRARRILTQVG